MTKIERFFARYEQGANSFDPDIVTSEFSDYFMGGDPNGVVCIQNNEEFRKAIPQRHAFFQQIGFRSAKILGLTETPLDERYTMAKVHWHMIFEKQPAHQYDFNSSSRISCSTPGLVPRLSSMFRTTMSRRS